MTMVIDPSVGNSGRTLVPTIISPQGAASHKIVCPNSEDMFERETQGVNAKMPTL